MYTNWYALGTIQLRRTSSKYAVNPFDDAVNQSPTQALYIGHSTVIYIIKKYFNMFVCL